MLSHRGVFEILTKLGYELNGPKKTDGQEAPFSCVTLVSTLGLCTYSDNTACSPTSCLSVCNVAGRGLLERPGRSVWGEMILQV